MNKRITFLIAFSAVAILPALAQAQRKSPLADAPAIRKKVELRSLRLEFGGGGGTTLNQDFYHSVFVNLKLGFHITDWLSLSGFGAFTVANMGTGFQDRVKETLPDANPSIPREPTSQQAIDSMSKISQILAAQLEFVPFTGKYSLFGSLFAHYDFYAFAGPGFLNIKPTDTGLGPCDDNAAARSCGVSGLKLGANVGVGIHSYINDFLALDLVLRDIVAQINPAGRDVNGDGRANASDLKWGSTYMVSLNLVLYLPSTPDISL
jgi:outer membrane beta-barrel protein